MKVDNSRVNLLERDIEDWLFENPGGLPRSYNGAIKKWIGRQYALPSGIADLIGVRESGMVVVVEIKNVPINKAAVLQVCRYQDDLKYIVSERMEYTHVRDDNEPVIEMILVGPSIDGQTFTEARAVGVMVYQFDVSFTLDINGLSWNSEHRASVSDQIREIAARPEWDIFGLTSAEDYEQFKREQAQLAEQELDEVFGASADLVASEIPEYIGDQRLVDMLASECPYLPDETGSDEQMIDDSEMHTEE